MENSQISIQLVYLRHWVNVLENGINFATSFPKYVHFIFRRQIFVNLCKNSTRSKMLTSSVSFQDPFHFPHVNDTLKSAIKP